MFLHVADQQAILTCSLWNSLTLLLYPNPSSALLTRRLLDSDWLAYAYGRGVPRRDDLLKFDSLS